METHVCSLDMVVDEMGESICLLLSIYSKSWTLSIAEERRGSLMKKGTADLWFFWFSSDVWGGSTGIRPLGWQAAG